MTSRSSCEGSGGGARPRTVTLEDLLQGERDLLITYGARRYRLHLTRQDKLILTKDDETPPAPKAGGAGDV